MDRGGEKPVEGTEELGSAEKYLGTGRINHAVVGNLTQGVDAGGFSPWVGDVGDELLQGTGTAVLQ